MFGWLWTLLFKLGFWKKQGTVLLLGIDNAGKTTLLHKLKYGDVQRFTPTQRARLEEVQLKNVHFRAWDLGGHAQVRKLWKDHLLEADGILFLIDSADHERLPEAKAELHGLLRDSSIDPSVPIAVLGNKSDLPQALTRDQLVQALELDLRADGKVYTHVQTPAASSSRAVPHETEIVRPMQVFSCSIIKGTGYPQAFSWMGELL